MPWVGFFVVFISKMDMYSVHVFKWKRKNIYMECTYMYIFLDVKTLEIDNKTKGTLWTLLNKFK